MAGLNALFDKRKLALARARLHAWWEGEAFDEAAVIAAVTTEEAAPTFSEAPIEDELFDAEPYEKPGRLVALGLLWGEGRIRPGDTAEESQVSSRLGLAPEGVLAVLGPGLAAPIAAVVGAHEGKIDVYEWREETFDALRYEVEQAKFGERLTLTRIDLEAHAFPANTYDGVFSVDDFAYCSFPPQLAHRLIKCLKPGARAVVECYAGEPSQALATAFASSFAEPQIRPLRDLLKYFADSGFVLESDEDITEDFLGLARLAFKQLGERLHEAGGLSVAAAQELAWEAEAWRARMTLLAQRRLERRRFILRKPEGDLEDQAENTKAPAG